MVLRIDYYYVLGPIAGLAILLPYVGVILSTVPAVAVAFFQYDGEKALLVFLVYSLLQFLEGNLLTPYIVGGKVKLFPLTVMIAFIFWGSIWGVAGAVLGGPSDFGDQGGLRARPRLGGRGAPPRRPGPAALQEKAEGEGRRGVLTLRPWAFSA